MDTVLLEYGFLGIILLLAFFSFLIGTQKMLQLIVSTSFIMLILLWRSGSLAYLAYYIGQTPAISVFSFSNLDLVQFVHNADTTTSLLIFSWLIIYAIHYSNHSFPLSSSLFSSKIAQILISPLAIMSMILCLSVAILGVNVFSLVFLQQTISSLWADNIVSKYLLFLPLCLLLQGLLTLLLLFPVPSKTTDMLEYDD